MSKRILIVEDTQNIRQIMAHMLKVRGYQVLESEDGDDGLAKARATKPDLILLDAMLPGRTGFEVCSELKSDPEMKQIPIIIVSAIAQGTGQSEDDLKVRSGAEAFVSKPFKAADLVSKIEEFLGASE